MTLLRALRYFVREALVSLVRSWKISLLAVLTIAVSLFLGGIFLLVSSNLSRVVEDFSDSPLFSTALCCIDASIRSVLLVAEDMNRIDSCGPHRGIGGGQEGYCGHE